MKSSLQIENLAPLIENKLSIGGRSREASGGEVKNSMSNFAQFLENSVNEVNQQQVAADQAIKELIAGRTKNIHETLLAVERADSSLRMMMQVRNKVLDAYKEIMRMQV